MPFNFNYFDLDESKGTNGALVSHLLLKENNFYLNLKSETTGKDILKEVSKNATSRLLLDVGALMVDLSNKQVAQEWLKLVSNAEAAVYFNENDLMIIDKQGNENFFEQFVRQSIHSLFYLKFSRLLNY